MNLKSDKLHFEIITGNSKPSGYIRNSYRENGTVKHQTIAKLNGLPLATLQNMKAAFDGNTVKIDEIKISDGREYGASAMLYELAKKIGLDKLIYSRLETWVRCVLAMIIGRIIYQGSKLALSNVTSYSCLWEVCGVKDIKIDVDKHCYDAMDELLARQESIQKKIAKNQLKNSSVILYDITSSYFEGEFEESELVDFGYNRDKKRGHKQIVIGLICTKEGCPVAVEVFRGNTNDGSTVQSKISEIKQKYGVSDFVFVGDRGMLTRKNIDSFDDDISTITALTHSAMRELCEEKGVQLSLFDEEKINEVVFQDEPGVRYALRRNPFRAEKDKNTRLRIIEKTEDSLKEIAVPKRKTTDVKLASRVAKVFAKYKSEKYFDWSIEDGKVAYSRKTARIDAEEKYDGLYVIRGEVSSEIMTIQEVVKAYKSLINVEQAFRNLKTVQLEIRPVYHHTDDRIKAHVFLCMLAYYLLWHMNKELTDFYSKSEEYTNNYVIEVMKTLQKCKLSIGDTSSTIVSEPSVLQKEILNSVLGEGRWPTV